MVSYDAASLYPYLRLAEMREKPANKIFYSCNQRSIENGIFLYKILHWQKDCLAMRQIIEYDLSNFWVKYLI